MWVSGFKPSKSHFAKVLGYLLQNDELDAAASAASTPSSSTFPTLIAARTSGCASWEIKLNTQVRTIAFEIKSRQSLTNPSSVGEILLSEFYRDIGFGDNFVIACIERRLQQRTSSKTSPRLSSPFTQCTCWRSEEGATTFGDGPAAALEGPAEDRPQGAPWTSCRRYRRTTDMFRHEKPTAMRIADELVAWVDAQKSAGGKTQHLVFVVDDKMSAYRRLKPAHRRVEQPRGDDRQQGQRQGLARCYESAGPRKGR